MALPEVVSSLWKSIISTKSFDKVLGQVKILSADKGQCTAEMTVTEDVCNLDKTLHGGFTCTLVDVISGIALITHESFPNRGVSVDLHVSFLSAAPLGEQILIEARTKKVGKTLAFLEVDLLNKCSNKLIAKGSHTKFIASR